VSGILVPMLLFAAGMGFLFVPLTISAVSGVEASESGAASGLLNVTQQVGGSLGLSILVTVFGTASRNETHALLGTGSPPPANIKELVLAHGISTAFMVGTVFAVIALVLSVVVIRTKPSDVDTSAIPGLAG
jgi:sugar phosphate permease